MTPRVPLATLAPGARFRLPDPDPSLVRSGTLLYVGECRARVRYDNEARHVELANGASFDAPSRALDISPNTMVEPLDAAKLSP